MREFIGSATAMELTGATWEQLRRWARTGIIAAKLGRSGSGNPVAYSTIDLLSARIGRAMRAAGITLKAAGDAVEALRKFSMPAIRDQLKAGNDHLLLIGDRAYPLLVPRAFTSSDELRAVLARWKLVDVVIVAVDVGAAFSAMEAKLAELEAAARQAEAVASN